MMEVDLRTEDKAASASYKVSKPGRKRKQFPVSDHLHRTHLNPPAPMLNCNRLGRDTMKLLDTGRVCTFPTSCRASLCPAVLVSASP